MFLGWFELLSTLRKKSNFPTFLVFFPKLYFSEREREREKEKERERERSSTFLLLLILSWVISFLKISL